MRCALGEADPNELLARAQREPHIDYERALAEPELAAPPLALLAGTKEPYTVGAGPRVAVIDFGCKRSIIRRLVDAGLEVVVCPPTTTPSRSSRSSRGRYWSATGRATRHSSSMRSRRCATCSAAPRSSASASATSCSGSRSGLRTYKLPFGHRGANHPVRVRGSKPRPRHRPEPRLRRRGGGRRAEVSHLSLNDGTVEGLEGDGFASLQFHPEAAPGPLDALPFFDRIADACRSAPTYAAS